MERKNHYIFTNKKHSKKGIMSTVFGTMSLTSLILALISSFRLAGNVPAQYGAGVLLSFVMALIGVLLGVISLYDRERFFLFSHLGILINVCAIILVAIFLSAGAYL